MKKIAIILFVILCHLTPSVVSGESKPSTKKLSEINKEIEANKTRIREKKKTEKRVATKLGKLKRDLRAEKRRLSLSRRQLKQVKHKTTKTRKQIHEIDQKIGTQSEKLGSRLREIYKNKNLGFFDYMFSPKNYLTALDQSYYFDLVIKSDMVLISDIKNQQDIYSKKKKKLEQQEEKISKLNSNIRWRQKKLSRTTKGVAKNLKELRKEIKIFEARNATLIADSREIADLIRKQSRGERTYYGTGHFLKPSKGWLSSRFGRRRHPIFKRWITHTGIDIAAPKGREIRAADTGYILFSGWKKGYGNVTIIDHGYKQGKRLSSVYAHQWRRLIRKGQYVRRGDLIGYVGSTGYSTGPHLHFEIRENGNPTNPTKYMRI